MTRKTAIAVILIVLILDSIVQARWSGGQSITWERDPDYGPVTIYTTVLEYDMTEDWLVTFVADNHPIHGLDMDVSTAWYFQPLGQILYATAGLRRGVFRSPTGWTPYLTITYRF